MSFLLAAASLLFCLAPGPLQAPAQKGAKTEGKEPPVKAIIDFEQWLSAWSQAHVLLSGPRGPNQEEVTRMEQVFAGLAAMGDVAAAKRLFKAAAAELPGVEAVTVKQAQPWLVQKTARDHIVKMKDPGIDAWLAALLAEKPKPGMGAQRQAAVEIVAARGGPSAASILEKTAATADKEDRIEAALALGRIGGIGSLAALQRLCREADPVIRTAAISGIGGVFAPKEDKEAAAAPDEELEKAKTAAVPTLRELACNDKVWQVRAAARDTLVRIRCPAAIPALIDALKAELARGKETQRHLVVALNKSLVMVTGQDIPEGRTEMWEEFWRKEGKTFRFSSGEKKTETSEKPSESRPARAGAGYAKYFDLDIQSDRILFVVDCSGSMAEKVRLKTRYAGGAGGGEHSKYELVKRELERVIRALPADASCNVIFFSTDVTSWEQDKEGHPKLMKMTDRNKGDVIQFIWQTQPSGSTNLWGGLDKALQLVGRGIRDKYYQTAFDTIFVLSDGAPTAGEITDTTEILRRVKEANELKRVVINAVTFGDEKNNIEFLRELAHQSGGEHIHVE